MIRLAWHQFRAPAAVALGVLLIVAALAAVTGPDLAHTYSATRAACARRGDCSSALIQFVRGEAGLSTALGTLVTIAPALLGLFWGAPLVAREAEAGTLPLAFTQSVTRTRWLLVKLGVVGLASALAAGLLSLVVTWWARPLDEAAATAYATFAQRDIAPIGYALFAFMLGVTLGLLTRRTVTAMAITLLAFVVSRVVTTYAVRPRLFTPAHETLALDPASTGLGSEVSPSSIVSSWFNGGPTSQLDPMTPTMDNAWIYSTRVVDGDGHDLTDAVLRARCPDISLDGAGPPSAPGHVPAPDAARQALQTCVTTIGDTYHELVTYQPAGRYWPLQWTELAIYVGAALLLAAAGVGLIRRRT